LSFAGEQRGYVELVPQGLKQAELDVFYDQDEEIAARLWGRDLTEYLDYVYRKGSRVCVMFHLQGVRREGVDAARATQRARPGGA